MEHANSRDSLRETLPAGQPAGDAARREAPIHLRDWLRPIELDPAAMQSAGADEADRALRLLRREGRALQIRRAPAPGGRR